MLHSLLERIKKYLYIMVMEKVILNERDDLENYFLLSLSYIYIL
jgi:hypothetical protein